MEITKESLNVFTEATIKSATEMEKIVGTLHILIEKQDKIVDRLMNGMSQEIIDGVVANYNNTHKETIDSLKRVEKCLDDNRIILVEQVPEKIGEKISNSSIAKDIEHVKWFIAIVGVAIIIATVVLRGIDNRAIIAQEVKTIQRALIADTTQR